MEGGCCPTRHTSPGFGPTVVDWLRELNDKRFTEVFYEAVAGRETSDRPDAQGHFILADAERTDEGGWDIDAIALPVESERADWSDEAPICQSGRCSACDTPVRSWAKHVTCPICGEAVHCT